MYCKRVYTIIRAMPKPKLNPRSKAIGYVTSNDDKASSPSNNAFVLFLLLLLLLLLGVVLLNTITEFLSLLLSRKVAMRVLRLPGRRSRAKREEDVEEREEVVAVTKEEVNIIIIIIECLLLKCFDDFC
jgi:hypothetical protein